MGIHGWRQISLLLAAFAGGYLVSNSAGILLGATLPQEQGPAVLGGYLAAFIVYPCAICWVFHVRRHAFAWAVLLALSALLAAGGLLIAGRIS